MLGPHCAVAIADVGADADADYANKRRRWPGLGRWSLEVRHGTEKGRPAPTTPGTPAREEASSREACDYVTRARPAVATRSNRVRRLPTHQLSLAQAALHRMSRPRVGCCCCARSRPIRLVQTVRLPGSRPPVHEQPTERLHACAPCKFVHRGPTLTHHHAPDRPPSPLVTPSTHVTNLSI